MGIEYSTEQHTDLPVTGAPKNLDVLKSGSKYIRKDMVVLKLRENGINYSVDDLDGEKYFEIQSTDLMDGSIKMLDSKGKVIASARKERFGPGKMANIIVKNGWSKKSEGQAMTAATLYDGAGKYGNTCKIFLHNPPIPITESNINSKLPDLVVEGDVMLKEYDFLVDNKIDKPVKIGKAVHEVSELKLEKGVAKSKKNEADDVINMNNYYLQIGRNIDIAFVVLCCHAMDLMFWDESYD